MPSTGAKGRGGHLGSSSPTPCWICPSSGAGTSWSARWAGTPSPPGREGRRARRSPRRSGTTSTSPASPQGVPTRPLRGSVPRRLRRRGAVPRSLDRPGEHHQRRTRELAQQLSRVGDALCDHPGGDVPGSRDRTAAPGGPSSPRPEPTRERPRTWSRAFTASPYPGGCRPSGPLPLRVHQRHPPRQGDVPPARPDRPPRVPVLPGRLPGARRRLSGAAQRGNGETELR